MNRFGLLGKEQKQKRLVSRAHGVAGKNTEPEVSWLGLSPHSSYQLCALRFVSRFPLL